jgi:predicted phosphodiesterase
MIKKIGIITSCLIIPFLAGCFSRAGSGLKVTDDQNDTYIFVQMTDNHLGYNPQSWPITERLINEINRYKAQKPIEFIAITGDLFDSIDNNSVLADFKCIRGQSNYPVYVLAGNHEFDLDTGKNVTKETVARNARKWSDNFGQFNYCVDIGKVRFVFLTTECLLSGSNIEGCEIYEWLEAKLREARSSSKRIIIFTHRPIVKDYYEGKWISPYPEGDYEKLKELVNKYHVNAIVAGHFHMEELYITGRVPVYVCPASVNPCGSGKFRVYEYDAKADFLKYLTFEIQQGN